MAEEVRIGGRVLLPGGAPLPEAQVKLLPLSDPLTVARDADAGVEPEPAALGLSDALGRFEIDAPNAGLWKVRVEAPGFVPLEAILRPLIDPEQLPDAQLATDVGLTVRVLAPDGSPVPGASVRLDAERSRFDFGGGSWKFPVRRGTTDAEGKLRLPRAQREVGTVSASAEGYAHASRGGLHGTAATLRLEAGTPRLFRVLTPENKAVAGVLALTGDHALPAGVTDDTGHVRLSLAAGTETPLSLLADDGRRLRLRVRPETKTPDKPRELTLPPRLLVPGRLIDGESRRPIHGGLVWDAEDPLEAAVTDSSGMFVLGGPEGRRLRITAGATGYLPARGREFQLTGDGRPGPTLVLMPAAAIEGSVVDESGEPVAGAQIDMKVKHTPGMMRIEIGAPSRPTRALTDADGSFRLSPIDPSENYTVKVRAEGFAPAEQLVTDLEARRTKTGMRIALDRGRTVIGVVVDEEGSSVRDVTIELKKAASGRGMGMMMMMDGGANGAGFSADSDDDGRFEIRGVPLGKFDLEAARPGFAKAKQDGIEIEAGDEPLDLGELTLVPGERFQGIVVDRDQQPVEGVKVFVSESGPMRMMLLGPGDAPEDPLPDAVTGPGGWFVIEDLTPGASYNLSLRRRGFVSGSVSAAKVPQTEPEEVVMEAASDIGGFVLDPEKEPIAGAQVNMRRSRTMEMGGSVMKMIMMESATSDAEGRFVFEDQEPGRVSLSAVASGWQEAKLDNIDVPKGEDLLDIELPLIAGAIVEGRVLTPDGRPAIGATVRSAGESSEGMMPRMGGAPTDGDGIYRLEGLKPGELSIEATHDEYPRVVKDMEVKEGINSLDLQLEGGHEVTGQVFSENGDPIGTAVVRLNPAGRMWGGPETRTKGDGTFSLAGVSDGDYRLWADAEGYAATDGEQEVKVASEPVHGLEVRLSRGGAISGRISGIPPEDYSDVRVSAQGPSFGGFDGRSLDREGGYRLENLLPGDYVVSARMASSGRQARGQVTLEPGQPEAGVDLQFGDGITLSGRAVQGDTPLAGATIRAEGLDVQHSGWNQTDQQGRFEIEGLEAGRYRVQLQNFQTGLRYEEEFDVATSREIELSIPTGRLGGRILDATDREPLAGVTVTLSQEQPDARGARYPHVSTTDLEGKFELGNVGDGTWNLTANKQGYAAHSTLVAIQFGEASESVEFNMDPTEGLTLQARLSSGAVPNDVQVAVLDPVGRALVTGTYATGENGRVRLSSVPPGSWEIIASAAGSAVSNLRAEAPGAMVPLMLAPACRLEASVPELSGSDAVATVSLTSEDGRPFRTLSWTGNPQSEWRMSGGRIEFGSLPPGRWTVKVATADGRNWQGTSVTSPGNAAQLVLE